MPKECGILEFYAEKCAECDYTECAIKKTIKIRLELD